MLSTMKERLQTLLNLEKLTAAQLASLLEIQRSTLSNILGGRNKPSYDLILSILTKLPNLNIEWLLEGKGKPYKDSEKNFRGTPIEDGKISEQPADEVKVTSSNPTDLFGFEEAEQVSDFSDFPVEDEMPQSEKISESSDSRNSQKSEEACENTRQSEKITTSTEFHPFPPLERENIEQQLKTLQSPVNKQVASKITRQQPSENRKFGENPAPVQKNRELTRVILCYSDGSFENYSR
ncbi:MAG: helix-turn-helix transcriptional regulator [Candidatus Egerieousia sp.]